MHGPEAALLVVGYIHDPHDSSHVDPAAAHSALAAHAAAGARLWGASDRRCPVSDF